MVTVVVHQHRCRLAGCNLVQKQTPLRPQIDRALFTAWTDVPGILSNPDSLFIPRKTQTLTPGLTNQKRPSQVTKIKTRDRLWNNIYPTFCLLNTRLVFDWCLTWRDCYHPLLRPLKYHPPNGLDMDIDGRLLDQSAIDDATTPGSPIGSDVRSTQLELWK